MRTGEEIKIAEENRKKKIDERIYLRKRLWRHDYGCPQPITIHSCSRDGAICPYCNKTIKHRYEYPLEDDIQKGFHDGLLLKEKNRPGG